VLVLGPILLPPAKFVQGIHMEVEMEVIGVDYQQVLRTSSLNVLQKNPQRLIDQAKFQLIYPSFL
jgi:hypothetical protein